MFQEHGKSYHFSHISQQTAFQIVVSQRMHVMVRAESTRVAATKVCLVQSVVIWSNAWFYSTSKWNITTGNDDNSTIVQFFVWLWQYKLTWVEYLVLTFKETQLPLEPDGKNGNAHLNYLAVVNELQIQHKIKPFLFTVEDLKCMMCNSLFTIKHQARVKCLQHYDQTTGWLSHTSSKRPLRKTPFLDSTNWKDSWGTWQVMPKGFREDPRKWFDIKQRKV